MKSSDIPTKIQLPFGASAGGSYIRPIPVPSQIPTTPGAASYTDGFPPLCFEQIALGGVPPAGQDFNGVLNAISALSRWFISGAPVLYDATFQTAIGGYPQGAIVQHASSESQLWVSTADDNTNALSAGGGTSWAKLADWLGITAAYTAAIAAAVASPTSVPGAAKAYARYTGAGSGSLQDSLNIASVTKNGTGDYTFNFTTAFSDANYAVLATPHYYDVSGSILVAVPMAFTAGSVRIQTLKPAGGPPYTLADAYLSISCFGT
jgi:hypothetical protein